MSNTTFPYEAIRNYSALMVCYKKRHTVRQLDQQGYFKIFQSSSNGKMRIWNKHAVPLWSTKGVYIVQSSYTISNANGRKKSKFQMSYCIAIVKISYLDLTRSNKIGTKFLGGICIAAIMLMQCKQHAPISMLYFHHW